MYTFASGPATVGVGAGPLFGAALIVLVFAMVLVLIERARQHNDRRRRAHWDQVYRSTFTGR